MWVCDNTLQEDSVEDRIGPIEPGKGIIWSPEHAIRSEDAARDTRTSCWLQPTEIPAGWLETFPTGAEIIAKAIELRQFPGSDPDDRLMRRRKCEFEIFRSIEKAIEFPWITKGFATVDEFIARAQTILQRRKARSGRSLELHARHIFIEEGLRENLQFSHQSVSESGKKPDFLFPSQLAYQSKDFPTDQLRMLAVKTTCKDRWRQVLNEADRIQTKHLLTLQEGVSEKQFGEMTESNVRLVVPENLINKFPSTVRGHLQTLESFIEDVRYLNSTQ